MRFSRVLYIVLFMFAATAGRAQMVFSFSPIASSSGGFTSSSNPVIVDGKGQCLVSTSGIAAMTIANNGKGAFNEGCKEVPPVATIDEFSVSLNIFPNPTHGKATIKCSGKFDENLSCQIRIISIDGKVMFSKMVPMKDVKAGYLVDAGAYAVGTYAVVIDFMDRHYSLKLIKV